MKNLIPIENEIVADQARDEALTEIARQTMRFETLQTRMSDSLDFRDVSVWSVDLALRQAFELGRRVERISANTPTCE